MSLYNALMGMHPFAVELLRVVGLRPDVVPRLRDVFITEMEEQLENAEAADGRELLVGVFTRTGGPNRVTYARENAWLAARPLYVRDYDDDFDATFATFEFRVPPQYASGVRDLWSVTTDKRPPMARFRDLADRLADPAHATDDDVVRAAAFGRKLMARVAGGPPDPDVDGHLEIVGGVAP